MIDMGGSFSGVIPEMRYYGGVALPTTAKGGRKNKLQRKCTRHTSRNTRQSRVWWKSWWVEEHVVKERVPSSVLTHSPTRLAHTCAVKPIRAAFAFCSTFNDSYADTNSTQFPSLLYWVLICWTRLPLVVYDASLKITLSLSDDTEVSEMVTLSHFYKPHSLVTRNLIVGHYHGI